jgi:hypothetical protein
VVLVLYRNETVEWIDADVVACDYAQVSLLRGDVVIMEPRLIVVRRFRRADIIDAVVV